MRNALEGPTRCLRDPSQAVQIIEEPADCSLDGAGFVPTHAVQKPTGDQRVNVGFGHLKQVAAKATLTRSRIRFMRSAPGLRFGFGEKKQEFAIVD